MAVEATVTTCTQPSTRASTVSSRLRVTSWSGVCCGAKIPEDRASCMLEGSIGSMSRAASSMRDMSMWIPAEKRLTRSRMCWRSHGFAANSRTCAASRTAT